MSGMPDSPRPRWALSGPWWLKEDPDHSAAGPESATIRASDGWQEIPPAVHLQPWLYPDNPYWGSAVRRINDSAWWYRTQFALSPDAGEDRLRLVFEAVDYQAEVWCNGHLLGTHEGDFSQFAFDVTDIVGPQNELVVKVTAPWDPLRRRAISYVDEVSRGMVKGLYEHADGLIPPDVNPIGIWRPVWLEAHTDITIERVSHAYETDEYDGSAHLTLHLHIDNRRPLPVEGVLHVYAAGETFEGVRVDDHWPIHMPPGQHVIDQIVRIPDPQWWWPWDMGRPDLYRVRCTLYEASGPRLDVHEQVTGLRQVRLIRSKETLHFQVNQVPFFVRGTTYMGGLYLSQLTSEQMGADLDRVRECGLNLIRVHVHVAPRELYEACDRRGILVWQDFPLNWVHDCTLEFEERAVNVLREMVAQLHAHPSILTWCCHNEPAALPFHDRNLTEHPDPRLYRELTTLDPTRPAFLCSGRQESDWLRSGDSHAYIGGAHGGHYLDAYGREIKLVTEFGCEAPLNLPTLNETPMLSDRLAHLRQRISGIQAYQAALLKYQIEWYRTIRLSPCGGYIQFMLVDLYPQIGCGVLDAKRRPKAAYEALRSASQPVHVMMEYTASGPVGLWVVNDLERPLLRCMVEWLVSDGEGQTVTRGSAQIDLPAQRVHRVTLLEWRLAPEKRYTVTLKLLQGDRVLDENRYENPFHPLERPQGFPWHFDRQIGMRCFGGPHASSSLRLFNTWYGRLAAWVFPVYDWAEQMLANKPSPRLNALLRRVFG
jgi:beta-mannosidase